jgi:hypothetical protein
MVACVFLAIAEGAALAGWLLTRWPRFGPRRAISVGFVLTAAIALVQVSPQIAHWLSQHGGAAVALTFGVVPVFGFLFWAVGCVLRLVLDSAGGRLRLR